VNDQRLNANGRYLKKANCLSLSLESFSFCRWGIGGKLNSCTQSRRCSLTRFPKPMLNSCSANANVNSGQDSIAKDTSCLQCSAREIREVEEMWFARKSFTTVREEQFVHNT
jgi:hypothetical protein